ncbi:retrotransposon protein, putative, ty1-copia subclass [Tanacetum coccineum]
MRLFHPMVTRSKLDGSLSRYKARLDVIGRNQQIGVDCDETFSPVFEPLPFALYSEVSLVYGLKAGSVRVLVLAVTLFRSSVEAEYHDVGNVVAEIAWLRNLLRELHSPLKTTTLVYYDNINVVYLSSKPVQHQRKKHIEIDIHFVRDEVVVGHVHVLHVPSRYQFENIFTKGLLYVLFDDFCSSLSVRPYPALTARAVKSMFEISGNNFNDWFRQFKMVLRVERKLFVIEQPISLASPTDSEYLRSGMRYMIHNEELKSMFEKQVGVEWFDLIQTFHACKQDEGKPVGPYHNMGKTVGELHAMLNEYKKGLPKKAETPQVMMIKGGKIQKANKKSLKAKGKNKVNGKGKDKEVYIPKPKNPKPTAMERPAKDDTCHHYKEVGHCKRNCPAYLAELIKKKKQVGTASSSDVFIIELFSFPTKSWVYDTSCDDKEIVSTLSRKGDWSSWNNTYRCVCPLRHVSRQGASSFITFTDDYSRYGYVYLLKHKHEAFETFKVFKNEVENQLGKTIKALRSDRGGEYISQEFKDYLKAWGIVQQLTPPYTPQHNGVSERRNRTLLDMVRSMMNLTTLPLSFGIML